MKYDVFISYSRDDSEFSDEICNVLNAYKKYYSFTYFIDREAITSKHDYLKRISKAITQSKTMLFLASKNSTSSDFCSKELLFADKRKIVIHQYRIDNSVLPDDIEMLLGTHHYRQASDFSIENMVQEVLSSALERNIESLTNLQSNIDNSFLPQTIVIPQSKGDKSPQNGHQLSDNVISAPYDERVEGKETEQNIKIKYVSTKKKVQPRFSYVKLVKTICVLMVIGFTFWGVLIIDSDKMSNQESFRETIIPTNYQAVKAPIGYFDVEKKYVEGLACVSKDNQWGFINEDRLIVIPLVFEDVFAFNEGFAQVKYNGKWGFVDNVGHIIVEPKYESVSKFVNGFAGVELDGKFGYINKYGELIIPTIYDNVWAFSGDKAKVWKDGHSFYITTTGARIE